MGEALNTAMITRLLRPRSIAVVGASDKPGALGASLLGNLDRHAFAGPIYPINPNRETIGGRACLSSIDDLPEGVDAAVLAIPRVAVLDAIRRLAERKCGAAIVFSAGFAEGGEEGLIEQAEIARIASEAGMVLEGPNCLGMVNHVDSVPLTFVETRCIAPTGRKAIGIVSQSGAMAAVLGTTLQARDVALSYSVSTGNEAASTVEDYVDWLVDEPNTDVVAMIVEQFRDPRRFLEVAKKIRAAGKQIVLLHPGKSSAARRRDLRRDDRRTGRRCRASGTLPGADPPRPRRVGRVRCLQGADARPRRRARFTARHAGRRRQPRAACRTTAFVPVSKPLDITAQGLSEPAIYTRALSALFDDPRVGAIICGIILFFHTKGGRIIHPNRKSLPRSALLFTSAI